MELSLRFQSHSRTVQNESDSHDPASDRLLRWQEVMTMRKLVSLALAATALALPSLALADTSRAELRRDRADVREERDEYRQALRHGSPRDIREEREEYRDAVRERYEDRRDWRDDRRDEWSDRGSRWDAPYAYRSYRAGWRADRSHYASRNIIHRPWAFGLPVARGPFQWVRHYGDALLVDMRSGHVRRVVPGVFRRTR
jgi:hypothetical protein